MKAASDQRHADMLEVLKLFRVVFASQKRYYRAVEQASGLGGAQMWALKEIHRAPGITVGELARRLAIHRSTATNLVNRLEALKLVVKQRHRKDQRNVQVETTARGAEIVLKSPKPSIGVLQGALLDVPPTTLRSLHRHLQTVVKNMRSRDPRAAHVPLSDL